MLKLMIENSEFCDSWTKKNPGQKRFTWQRINPPCKSVLDYWFIPILLENRILDCQIITAPRTDHLAVKMKITTGDNNRGKGTWKFNNSLLEDEKYTIDWLIEKNYEEYKDIIACKIRQNKDVKGIKLPLHNYPKNEAKISLYADDITIFVNDEREVKETVNILNSFYEFSGLKLNTTKTEAMWVLGRFI